MNQTPRSLAWCPNWEWWPLDCLREAWALAVGAVLEHSTKHTYASALRAYSDFCDLHQFPLCPTPDSLSFFVVYMSHRIKPSSVKSYLSGICAELEPIWPDVRTIRMSPLVTKSLAGCHKLFRSPANRKWALSESDLKLIQHSIGHSPSHDDLLFLAITFTAWHGLMRLGELVNPDKEDLRDHRKIISHRSVKHFALPRRHISFTLPMHKADRLFQGSTVVIECRLGELDPLKIFDDYLSSRDHLFPHLPELWLKHDSRVPTCSWFILRLCNIFPNDNIAGHSLRSGGATALAIAGTPLDRIQMIGHWSSEAFLIYLHQNPILLQGDLLGVSPFDGADASS